MARCYYKSCGFTEKVSDEKSYFKSFEKNSEDHKRKIPSYDLSFSLLRKFAVAYKLNGYKKSMHSFYFFMSLGHYTGESATSLNEFAEKIRKIDARALEFHFHRRDFERWVTQALGDMRLAKEINELRKQNPVGETLRGKLCHVVLKRLAEKKTKLPVAV